MNSEFDHKFAKDPNQPDNIPDKPTNPDDPMSLFTDESTPEQVAEFERVSIEIEEELRKLAAGEEDEDDPLGIREELERLQAERRKITFKKIFNLVRDKLIDISPSFIVNEDKFIEKFQRVVGSSLSLSRSAGMLYNVLASHGLRKPDKEYSHEAGESLLPQKTELIVKQVRRLRGMLTKKSQRVAATPELLEAHYAPSAPFRVESQEQDHLFQGLVQKVGQDGRTNTIEETVFNYLREDRNHCTAILNIFNRHTGQILDMEQLIPQDYYFVPATMKEFKEEIVRDENNRPRLKVSNVPKNLNSYEGMQTAPNDFYENKFGRIGYGNLKEKGGILSLLHEIAHAWQSKYQENHGRGNFENFYNEVTRKLEFLEFWKQTISDPEEQEEFEEIELKPTTEELKKMGVEIDPKNYTYTGQVLGNGTYKVSSLGLKKVGEDYDWVTREFVITSDKVKPLVEDFVKEERDAWAHAIRVLRYLRKQGFDLEPELKSLNDIQDVMHHALGTYQASIEAKLDPTNKIKKFTAISRYKPEEQKS